MFPLFLYSTNMIHTKYLGLSETESMRNAMNVVLKITPYRHANAMNYHQFMGMWKEIGDNEFNDLVSVSDH